MGGTEEEEEEEEEEVRALFLRVPPSSIVPTASDELFNGAAAVNETVAGMEFAANALVIRF